MELYKRIIEIIDVNLIYCLIPIILTLILVEFSFKNRFETRKTLNLIRWTIIIYTIITWVYYLIEISLLDLDKNIFINRLTGSYAWTYWMMFVSALLLPFTLLVKKLALKFWYVLFIAFTMKIGLYFERFVIIVSSFHREYMPENGNTELENGNIELFVIGMIFLQGIIIAILTLGILEIKK